jgi:hypothetical protein
MNNWTGFYYLTRLVLIVASVLFTGCGQLYIIQSLFDESSVSLKVSGTTSVVEGSSHTVTLTLSQAAKSAVSVSYRTQDDNTLSVFERAEVVQNYAESQGTVTFAPGETTKNITIPTYQQRVSQKDKTFSIRFSTTSHVNLENDHQDLKITSTASPVFGAEVDKIYAQAGDDHAPTYIFPDALETIYVDQVSGSDSNGGSESSAFLTIQHAVDVAAPGTKILVKNGSYKETINFPISGTAAHPIVVAAAQGQTPVVTGAEVVTGSALVADPAAEQADFLVSGFEEATLDSNFTLSSGSADGGTNAEIDTTAADAAQGLQALRLTFPSASGTNAGTHIYKSFGSSRAAAKSKIYVRTYLALDTAFAMAGGSPTNYIIIGNLEGLNSSDVDGTTFARLRLRKDGTNNRYYFQLVNTSNATMYSSTTDAIYVTPGAGYVYFELGYDNSDATNPVKFDINGTAITLANQLSPTLNVVNKVRLGAVHVTGVGYPAPGSYVYLDSVRMGSTLGGAFSAAWPLSEIAAENFESSLGSFTKNEQDGNTVATSAAFKKYGAQSARFSFGGTSGVVGLTQTLSSIGDSYVRFYMYMDAFDLSATNSSPTSNTTKWTLLTLAENATPRVILSLVKTTLGFKLDANILTPSVANISNFYAGYPGELKNGNWYQVEMRFKGNSTAGGSELWVNAVSVGANYDRTPTPDVYYGIDTSGMKINKVVVGEATSGQSYSSTTYPTAGSALYIDDYRVSAGAPSGETPNSQSLAMYSANFSPAVYTGQGTAYPRVMILTDAEHPEGKALRAVENKNVVTSGTFAVEGSKMYFRPFNEDGLTGKTLEFGVRDSGFAISGKDHIVIQGFNVRGSNNPNKAAVYIDEGGQSNSIIRNILHSNAGGGVRIEAEIANDGLSVVRGADSNQVLANHILDNFIVFGSGIRIGSSNNTLIEHNLLESEAGTNVSMECEFADSCRGTIIRRNKFTSAGESNIYLAVRVSESQVYSNWIYGARASSYATMKLGIRGSSGGSGVHIARASHDNWIFNNLIYDADTGGIALRAKTWNNKIFNNTIVSIAGKGVGTGIDFQKDGNEAELPDENSNGTLDGQEDVENNMAFNNIISNTPGSNRCIDVDGYDADSSNAPAYPDTSNLTDYNLYNKCGRLALFNGASYTEAQFANFKSDSLSAAGLARDTNSIIVPNATALFIDLINGNYRTITDTVGACQLGTNCPWTP